MQHFHLNIQTPPPIMNAITRTVRIPAPALSFVVMGDSDAAGSAAAVVPAVGSLADVAPVRKVRGIMLESIKLAPMTDKAAIYCHVSIQFHCHGHNVQPTC